METIERNLFLEKLSLLGDIILREASVLAELIEYVQDIDNICKRISFLESDADDILHSVKITFKNDLTELDADGRDLWEILLLAETCTDSFEDLTRAFNSYNVTSLREEIIPVLVSIESAARFVSDMLATVGSEEALLDTHKALIEINHLQDETVRNISACLKTLFVNEKDPIEIIKWKEVYSLTQQIFDDFEDLADKCEDYIFIRA